jgi:hypothetical protein
MRGYVPAHCHGHQNDQQNWFIFSSLFVCLLPWWLLGQYGASSHPMAVSSGFQYSPGHAALAGCSLYCTGGPPWPLKQPVDKVHLIVINVFTIIINLAIKYSNN